MSAEALDAFDDPNSTTAAPVHRAVRIVTRCQDYAGQIRLVTWTIDIESRGSKHGFLIETERQLEQGQRRPDVFDRGWEYIARSLCEGAPEALEKFNAAEEPLDRGSPKDLAHALTSCRRMIKALADALSPLRTR